MGEVQTRPEAVVPRLHKGPVGIQSYSPLISCANIQFCVELSGKKIISMARIPDLTFCVCQKNNYTDGRLTSLKQYFFLFFAYLFHCCKESPNISTVLKDRKHNSYAVCYSKILGQKGSRKQKT